MKRKKEPDSDDDLLTEKRKKKKTKKEAISDVIEDSEDVVEEKKHNKKKKASKKNVDDDEDEAVAAIDMVNDDEENEEKQVESIDHAEGKTKKKIKHSEKVDIVVEEVQGVTKEEKGITSVKDLAKLHSAKLNKMLPNRAEKARRDIQKKIGSYVLELRQKGITDPKEVKKLKEKYKKSLSKQSPSSGNASAPSIEDNHFSDISLDCKDCGKTFIFSAAEQKFYEGRGFSPAVRCKPCKNAKKERMEWADETTKKGKKGQSF